jgi:hypothetical protein
MTDKHLPGLALLEALRPPPGWRTDRALISTYSADPAVLIAVLLALAGREDETASGTRIGLARAFLELRGRVTIVLQRGRLTAPRRGRRVLRLLDRFVHEMPWNEGPSDEGAGRSWHAKCAVARFVAEDGEAMWRMHVGSRNLTPDLSWDIGLRLDSIAAAEGGQRIRRFDRFVQRLAAAAGQEAIWAPFLAEVAKLRWDVPRGLDVRRLDLMLPEDAKRSLPTEPEGVGRIVAVSPFLDGYATGRISDWGGPDTERSLVSTRPALSLLAGQVAKPLKGFDPLVVLPETTDAQDAVDEDETANESGNDATVEIDGRGLHAKLLWAEHAAGATLWLGSVNLTRRGWTTNAEIVAEIGVERRGQARAAREVSEGIEAFRGMAVEVKSADLLSEAVEETTQARLEEARRALAAGLEVHQELHPSGGVRLIAKSPPDLADPAINLLVGQIAGEKITWPRGAGSVDLPMDTPSVMTELIVFTLRLEDDEVSWTQVITFAQKFDEVALDRRDVQVLGAWLGPRALLTAIGDLLGGGGEDGMGEQKWDSTDGFGDGGDGAVGRPMESSAPTIEQVMRAWVREPERLALVGRLVEMSVQMASDSAEDQKAIGQLQGFRKAWATLNKILSRSLHGP